MHSTITPPHTNLLYVSRIYTNLTESEMSKSILVRQYEGGVRHFGKIEQKLLVSMNELYDKKIRRHIRKRFVCVVKIESRTIPNTVHS